MANDHLTFYGTTNIGNSDISVQLEDNLVIWLNWCFLNIGAFNNVTIPSSGNYQDRRDILRCQDDQNFSQGQVFQGFRQDWVWETGLLYTAATPIQVSGVHISGTFYPTSTTTGQYRHHIDYPNGRVIFHEPISINTVVQANYSYRHVQIHTANEPWFEQLQYNSLRADDSHFSQVGSGAWNVDAETRIQMPAIVIEQIPRSRAKPHELGSLVQWKEYEFLFYCLSEQDWMAKQLANVIENQNDRHIFLLNINNLIASGEWALNISGSLNSGAKMYPELIAESGNGGYRYKKARFKNASFTNLNRVTSDLWEGVTKISIEVLVP